MPTGGRESLRGCKCSSSVSVMRPSLPPPPSTVCKPVALRKIGKVQVRLGVARGAPGGHWWAMPDGARGAAGSVRAAARGGSKALADQTEGCRLRLPLHAHAHAGRPRMCGHRAAKGHSRARARLPLSGLRNVEGFAGEHMMGVSQKEPTANRPLMRRRPGPWMAKRKMPGALAGRPGRSLLIESENEKGIPKIADSATLDQTRCACGAGDSTGRLRLAAAGRRLGRKGDGAALGGNARARALRAARAGRGQAGERHRGGRRCRGLVGLVAFALGRICHATITLLLHRQCVGKRMDNKKG